MSGEDWLQLDDDASRERSPALVTSPAAGSAELLAEEWRHRNSGSFPGANEVLFTRIDEQTGDESLEQAERWQRIMAWPRLPSIEEAMAFKANADAKLEVAFWGEVRAAVAKDQAAGQRAPAARRPGAAPVS